MDISKDQEGTQVIHGFLELLDSSSVAFAVLDMYVFMRGNVVVKMVDVPR
jgi:hypothetical protein